MSINPVFIVTIIAVAAIFFVAFKGVKVNDCFQNLNVEGFKEKMKSPSKEVVVLDVRTSQEVAQDAIKGAINIDVYASDFNQKIAELDKSKTYLVYCRSGARSARACSQMCKEGFENIFNLQGGYLAWSRSK